MPMCTVQVRSSAVCNSLKVIWEADDSRSRIRASRATVLLPTMNFEHNVEQVNVREVALHQFRPGSLDTVFAGHRAFLYSGPPAIAGFREQQFSAHT
jgi:hypothetical protein